MAWIVTWYDGERMRHKSRKARRRAMALAKSKAPIAHGAVEIWQQRRGWMTPAVDVVYDDANDRIVVADVKDMPDE